jgi:hypothetical protein
MAISFIIQVFFLSYKNDHKRLHAQLAFLRHVLCSISPQAPPPPPPSLLLPDCPQYCHCLQCRRLTQGTRLPLFSTVRPLPVATRHLLWSALTPPPLNLPSEVPIGVLERDKCPVPQNGPSSVVLAARSSSSGSGPILMLSSSLSLAAAAARDDERFLLSRIFYMHIHKDPAQVPLSLNRRGPAP